MNDICVYLIRTYEEQISHNYYYQIMIHEVCDEKEKAKERLNNAQPIGTNKKGEN
jgi:hypothetical protein